jgi:ABC-2 type transport system permease protein
MTTRTREPAVDRRSSAPADADAGWRIVAGQECRELWLSGRAVLLLFAFSMLLSVLTYLAATNQVLNFLERREAVSLLVQTAVAVGALLTLVVSADAISGERERETLESLLLAPVSRRAIVAGKLLAALSLWIGCLLVLVPYVWVLGRGLSITTTGLAMSATVGTLLSIGLAAMGITVSTLANSNRVSLAASLFLLLALYVPTQLPAGPSHGWFFDLLQRVDPVAASLHYLSEVLVAGHAWTRDLEFLIAPAVLAITFVAVLVLTAPRLVTLRAGRDGS